MRTHSQSQNRCYPPCRLFILLQRQQNLLVSCKFGVIADFVAHRLRSSRNIWIGLELDWSLRKIVGSFCFFFVFSNLLLYLVLVIQPEEILQVLTCSNCVSKQMLCCRFLGSILELVLLRTRVDFFFSHAVLFVPL